MPLCAPNRHWKRYFLVCAGVEGVDRCHHEGSGTYCPMSMSSLTQAPIDSNRQPWRIRVIIVRDGSNPARSDESKPSEAGQSSKPGWLRVSTRVKPSKLIPDRLIDLVPSSSALVKMQRVQNRATKWRLATSNSKLCKHPIRHMLHHWYYDTKTWHLLPRKDAVLDVTLVKTSKFVC